MRRAWPKLLALLLAGLATTACTPSTVAEPLPVRSPVPSPSEAAGPPADTFRYALTEPVSIVPGDAVDHSGLTVVDAVFDSLTTYGPQGQVYPSAAIYWEPNEDATVWTFTLRKGAPWHGLEGESVTAEDFAFAWNRAVADGAAGYHLEDVVGYQAVRDGERRTLDGLRTINDHTLEVRLSSPFADFPAVVAHPTLGPLPRERFDDRGFALAPIGNGPFQLAEPWAKEQFIRVSRFDGWRNSRQPVEISEVLFQIRDPETAYVAFQQGRMDFTPLPAGAYEQARERYGASDPSLQDPDTPTLLDERAGELYFLGMNLETPPFDQVDVRRALSLAINREAIAGAVRGGSADPARGVVPRAIRGTRSRACAYCRFDPDAARQLFADAEVRELELWINAGGGHEQVADLLGEQLAAVGVTLTVREPRAADDEASSLAAYLRHLRDGDAPLFRFGWVMDHPILDDGLRPVLSGALAGADGGGNYGGYRNEDVDALLDEARAQLDRDERQRLYLRAEDIALNRDQAIIPLLTFRHTAVVSERFEGFVLNTAGQANLAEVRPVAAVDGGGD